MAETSQRKPSMKLKLNTKRLSDGSRPPDGQPLETPTPSSGGLKLKFGGQGRPSGALVHPQPPQLGLVTQDKRKGSKKNVNAAEGTPTSGKKRKSHTGDDGSPAVKRSKAGVPAAKLEDADDYIKTLPKPRPSIPKIRLTSSSRPTAPPRPSVLPRLKVKHKGKPPQRPMGVGYDSEASDAEEDPAIVEGFILRMTPGEDCDYLRKAIEERKIGIPKREGGADVWFKWLGPGKDGRRAVVVVRGNLYAAVLVDLPCVIEGMKSWDKKAWYKSTDICQMLLVLGRIDTEEQAKNFSLPRGVDPKTYQYAHGITPPMHWARKRRFRKRISYRTIEAVEEEVERLFALDEQAQDTKYEVLDLDQLRAQEEAEEDAQGEEYYEEAVDDQIEQEDGFNEADFTAMMEEQLAHSDVLVADRATETGNVISGVTETAVTTDASNTPSNTADEPGLFGESTDHAAPTPGAIYATGAEESSEVDEEDEDDADAEDEVDEDLLQAQQERAQQLEEVTDLENAIKRKVAERDRVQSQILKVRINKDIEGLGIDLRIKRAGLGLEEDESEA